jgi:hypothetical protein
LTVPSENVAVAVNWLVSPTDASTAFPLRANLVTDVGGAAGADAGAVGAWLDPPHAPPEHTAAATARTRYPVDATRDVILEPSGAE